MIDPIALIKHKINTKRFKQKHLIGVIGDAPTVSKVLNYKRKLTLKAIRNLHKKYNLPLIILIQDYKLIK